MTKDNLRIGTSKTRITKNYVNKPKKKYRVIVQEKPVNGNTNEAMRSFMIYDFDGKSTVDSMRKKLMKLKNN